MQSEMLKFVINELSVGNWVQNSAFYALLLLLFCTVTRQIQSPSKIVPRERRALK